ncbi:hypothetical protein H7K24_05280 [Mycobacterium fragae]|uniref:Uncharacterized protein n=1 Tax=Mycobacterium fragae TaxID=1260918 RepID=A0A1X1V659_9MYCO|nr:hypothetical protein [Mycobacterium fragae]MCV7399565.1 hypothetical protein [Mycobacterium fragae]ORV64527.1 hypothetical protein AWC06_05455 [Mycobacterium fragae]
MLGTLHALTFPFRGRALTLVGAQFAFVGYPLALVSDAIALISETVAFIREPFALPDVRFTPREGIGTLVEVV